MPEPATREPELDLVERRLRERLGPRLRTAFPLAPLTSFRIGGPAALFVEAEDDDDLAAVAAATEATDVSVAVIGKGSNILISDRGFPGIVLRLGRGYRWAARDGSTVTAGGAMPLPALASVAMRHRLAGLEFGVAIPASLGGAVKMNAGAHGRSMSDVLDRVELFLLGSASGRRSVPASEAGFRYRTSGLPAGAVVVGAAVSLQPGEDASIRDRMEEAREWRRRTQPIAEPNCGSVFKNPEGAHAAQLIEAAGAKGLRIGGAQVSTKHANFIVTDPGASSADVWTLVERVRELVASRSGIRLETEVQLLGAVADAIR